MDGEQPILEFSEQSLFRNWLSKNHAKSNGIWLKFYKKNTSIPSINYAEALDEALCFGWIDGQVKRFDEKAYLQRFTPRRSKSTWSQRNTEHIARLTKLNKMTPSGVAEVERAKADGRWDRAYAPPSETIPPKDFLKALGKNKKAKDFFESLNKTNSFAIIWQIEGAKKQETRERRIKKFVEMLERNEKLY